MMLPWPDETVVPHTAAERWCEPGSNRVLDFHGDPLKAGLAVFSDGNQHMALLDALKAFYDSNPGVADIFYATTPPGPLVSLLKTGSLRLGNLTLSVKPHVFISPPQVLDRPHDQGHIRVQHLLARNQGSVLLVRRDNTKGIRDVRDLMRADVRLFISNPDAEKVSHEGYRQTLERIAAARGLDMERFSRTVFGENAVRGRRIHHREAPEAVAAGVADAAIVYYHLALRYVRLFADVFDMIPLERPEEKPPTGPQSRNAAIHMGMVGGGGEWGASLMAFLQTRTVADIYFHHGLLHVLDIPQGR